MWRFILSSFIKGGEGYGRRCYVFYMFLELCRKESRNFDRRKVVSQTLGNKICFQNDMLKSYCRMSQNNADRGDFALSVKQNDVLYHIEIKVSENVNTVIVLADFYRKL